MGEFEFGASGQQVGVSGADSVPVLLPELLDCGGYLGIGCRFR